MIRTIAFATFALLGVAGVASADVVNLPTNQPVYFQFNNIEQFNNTNTIVVPGGYNGTETQGNWGVFNISTIQLGAVATPNQDISGGTPFFVDGGVGGLQITGIFYDIQVDPLTGDANGGFIDIFANPTGTIDASCLNGVGCAPDASTVTRFTSGTFLARLEFASGINPGDPNVFIDSSVDPATLTGTGRADSFANVVVGATVGGLLGQWEDDLNGDWFITTFGTRDIRFSNFFNLLAAWNTPSNATSGTTIGLRSNDPGRVFTAAAAVPEPATLTLLGLGLAGLGYRRRRKA